MPGGRRSAGTPRLGASLVAGLLPSEQEDDSAADHMADRLQRHSRSPARRSHVQCHKLSLLNPPGHEPGGFSCQQSYGGPPQAWLGGPMAN
jgi:hypothetical protein